MDALDPESADYAGWKSWKHTCQVMADDLAAGFKLIMPHETFTEEKVIDFGNLTVKITWLGKSGTAGKLLIFIPEEGVLYVDGIIHHAHVSPTLRPNPEGMDVERWIAVVSEALSHKEKIKYVVTSLSGMATVERLEARRDYWSDLWDDIKTATAAGKSYDEAKAELDFNGKYAYLKKWPEYRADRDDWWRAEHGRTLMVFWEQLHKSAANELVRVIDESGIKAALVRCDEMLEDESNEYFFEENSLNGMGYKYLNEGKLDESIALFRMAIKALPKSSNLYDSLGEAYLKSGDEKNAVLNYKKSLELNSNNDNAKKVLMELDAK
jgi:tetratricopeptide (TPR) repeat protein